MKRLYREGYEQNTEMLVIERVGGGEEPGEAQRLREATRKILAVVQIEAFFDLQMIQRHRGWGK